MNENMQMDPLAQLIQEDQFVGWVFQIDYESATVITNDVWKTQANGISRNCFLLATSIVPGEPAGEVILLRVMGSAPLPADDKLIGLKIADLKNRAVKAIGQEMDNLTKSEIQFSGLACRILGTFYNQNGALRLGAVDSAVPRLETEQQLERFGATLRMNPNPAALGDRHSPP